jgi:hypothetical protein
MDVPDWELFPSPWFDLPVEPTTSSVSSARLHAHTSHHDASVPSSMLDGSQLLISDHAADSQPWEALNFDLSIDVESMPWGSLQEEPTPLNCGTHGTEASEVAGAPSTHPDPLLALQPAVSEPPAPAARTRIARKPKIRKENWVTHKERIRKLYIDEDRKLEEVMEIMKDEHGFDAR